MLDVPCLQDLLTPVHGRFGKLLPFAQLAHCAGAIELALESLQGAIYIFSFFNGYN